MRCLEGYPPPDPGKKCIRLLRGSSSINLTPRRGTKGLMWGARGPFLPAAAMVVMVVVGSWSLGRVSTVGIVYFFYGINLFFGPNIYRRTHSISNQNVPPFLLDVSKIAYIGSDQYVYYSYALGKITTRNHKPQLLPQHCNHHDEVRKNGIPYAVGLMRSIGYRQNRLVNRKTAIIVKMTLHVGISKK